MRLASRSHPRLLVSSRSEKLAKYRAKRDFAVTAEPSGSARDAARARFVIQQHAARRMHYDFRLEHGGVLWSWSVPKGPSLSPKQRRLAVRTEDHPVDYAGFEGTIPKGQYGAGAVSVWDRGMWHPEGDADAAMKSGRLTFTLDGEKLHGRWHLVRTKPQGTQETWLLFKGRDDFADDDTDIIADKPASVISGRDIAQIAAAPGAVWNSKGVVAEKPSSDELHALLRGLGVPLTNLDKVLYAQQGITKGQLVGYVAAVAPWFLRYTADRPVMAVRCPNGPDAPCFFQKHALKGAPASIARIKVAGEHEPYMAVHDLQGLIALAQLGTLEVHTWGARVDDLEHPDVLVLDLDPDEALPWERVALAAIEVKKLLHELGLESFVKTTGGKGLHVQVPIARRTSWTELKSFARGVAMRLEREQPRAYVSTMTKHARTGKIYLDYLRNGRGATFIAPYSPRARDGAPVATPITWDELAAGIKPAAFTLRTLPARLEALGDRDPWAGYGDVRQSITAAARKAVAVR
jgi:bifunctional non-homologous end joining protein LigD